MWISVMLCWWVLHGVQVSAGAVHSNVPKEVSYLSDIGKRTFSRFQPEQFATDVEEELLMDNTRLSNEDEDSVSTGVQLRSARSPRHCFRHQESCLGRQLRCCDPCDTCHCRFFNAFCYCRRISQACLHGRQ